MTGGNASAVYATLALAALAVATDAVTAKVWAPSGSENAALPVKSQGTAPPSIWHEMADAPEGLNSAVPVGPVVVPSTGCVIVTAGGVTSYVMELSVLVEAMLALPAALWATPASTVAITVPPLVMPDTATL